ncbi:MAG: hypothetical protein A2747_03225 [Candidatus Yonathbacteria bacterium RIFCSPHIGHO2_01_FULL_44_41]|uniref:Uncharacterized protein n=1 Tax=Candidatus Yonathbacteria bacterium RIFCSPHIGHO2_02_FULL_44_14 TaxID=1802724 RepID=A0A1G2S890_9BACT|nr:MAG: hypothetical protein A2747_03225 [Candidatus Yonathbacteria bacterium RIFCSPHIGHO2_01_FULL_44_41]OHA80491.1 MAG: hypothetical protein A3D51_00175 [Candidatus Yonathbacteria bacterium RIFCSPHIGHO2_02_FULL_44_14]OHA82220.1 MAG: hypothetical protein A3B06_01830 [Candidatus Yonathbacteria bacterium RIFCSPLOWO2_01_FULL_43_20]
MGKKLPEVYHFGYNGTHFQILIPFMYWVQFVNLTGKETQYASDQGQAYVPPSVLGGSFGQHGCARFSKTLGRSAVIEVPAFLENPDDENQIVGMRDLGHTLSSILFILQHILHDADEGKKDVAEQESSPVLDTKPAGSQLFVLETIVAREPGQFHGAGLGLSLSPVARKYLESLGKGVDLDGAMESMKEHFFMPYADEKFRNRAWHGDFVIRLREYGVLHLNTRGNCACMGTEPKDFGDRGYSLLSHNVDTVAQQFNLLVGIANVWQMVRGGLRAQS